MELTCYGNTDNSEEVILGKLRCYTGSKIGCLRAVQGLENARSALKEELVIQQSSESVLTHRSDMAIAGHELLKGAFD